MITSRLRLASVIFSAGLLLSLSARDRVITEIVKDPMMLHYLYSQSQTQNDEADSLSRPTPYGMQDLQGGPGWIWRPTPEELERFTDILERYPSLIPPDGAVERWTLEMTPERRKQVWMEDDLTLQEDAGFVQVEQDVAEDTKVEGSYI